jgi:hypothetical protein
MKRAACFASESSESDSEPEREKRSKALNFKETSSERENSKGRKLMGNYFEPVDSNPNQCALNRNSIESFDLNSNESNLNIEFSKISNSIQNKSQLQASSSKVSDLVQRETIPTENAHYLYDELYEELEIQKPKPSCKGESKFAAKFMKRSKEKKKPTTDPNSIVIITEAYKNQSNNQHVNDKKAVPINQHQQQQIIQLKEKKDSKFDQKYISLISKLVQSAIGEEEIEAARQRYFERVKRGAGIKLNL